MKNTFLKTILNLLLILLIFLSFNCSSEEDIYFEKYSAPEAWMMIQWAVDKRKAKCGEKPPTDLYVLGNTTKFAVDACVYMLVKEACPFTEYPVACYEIYGIDIPGLGP